MIELIKQNCCGCSSCVNACPQKCVQMKFDLEGFAYPTVNKDACVNCGLCEDVCPIINNKKNNNEENTCYAAKAKDIKKRINSSSGGVFQFLAEYIIRIGGVVVAPVFDENFMLRHCLICDEFHLLSAIGSKYVQSDIGSVYKSVENLLKDNRYVYFAGTPCQIVGLKRYLRKEYSKLYTQDIICHGVPSPLIWKKYINYLNRHKKKIISVNFRDKSKGWRRYSLSLIFKDGKQTRTPSIKDPYLKIYMKNISIRPSCYNCNIKGDSFESDITLGDFWGIEKVCPSLDDDRGTSLVMIHSHKGQLLFNNIRNNVDCSIVDKEQALKYNPSAIIQTKVPDIRTAFFEEVNNKPFMKVMKKYSSDGLIIETKRTIKSWFI